MGPGHTLLSPRVDGEGPGSAGQGWLSETNYGSTGAQAGLEATVYLGGFAGCPEHIRSISRKVEEYKELFSSMHIRQLQCAVVGNALLQMYFIWAFYIINLFHKSYKAE